MRSFIFLGAASERHDPLDLDHLIWSICHRWGRAAHFQAPSLKQIMHNTFKAVSFSLNQVMDVYMHSILQFIE